MAGNDGAAALLRDALSDLEIAETRMFGGIAFLHRGHMIAATHRGGVLLRVGRPHMAAALALPGVAPAAMAGTRPMAGWVTCGAGALSDPARRDRLLGFAREFNIGLPVKPA